MKIRSHGAAASWSLPPKLMRPWRLGIGERNGAASARLYFLRRCRSSFAATRSSRSPSHFRIVPQRFIGGRTRMGSPGGEAPRRSLWDISRGFVFANDDRVVYPRLPMAAARYHSAPELSTHERFPSESSLALHGNSSEARIPTSGRSDGHGCVASLHDAKASEDSEAVTEKSLGDTVTAEEALKPEAEAHCEPPFTPLDFKIPDDTFQAAKCAPEGSPESFWSYTLYRGPCDDGGAKIKVHYCSSKHTTERVLQQYFMGEKIVGFDLEWASDATKAQGVRRNISLVQLASPSRIALFHLALYPNKDDDMIAPSLKKIMEDPEVTKVGVAIKGDCTRLRNFLGMDARGLFELSHLYKLVKYSTTGELELVNKRLVSMATQVQDVLQLPLFKGLDVRGSDWSRSLMMEQIIYSASDAYAAVQLFHVLDHQRQSLDPAPPLPHHAELNLPIKFADQVILPTSADEESEIRDESCAPTVGSTAAFTEYVNSIAMSSTIKVEVEDSAERQTTSITTTTAISATRTATTAVAPATNARKPTAPQHPKVAEAELWARQRCAEREAGKAPAYALRAYYLWHKNESLGPEDVASLLRDPPLALGTVIGYITDSIRQDKLVFDKRRLREEVLAKLPKATLETYRYKGLVKACKEDQES